jgi:hypothetical protein
MTAAENAQYVHQKDVIYGYKHGMALIMDVFTPANGEKRNGAGVPVLTDNVFYTKE